MITRGLTTMALLNVLLVILLSLFLLSFAAVAVLAAPLEVSLVGTFAVGSGSRGLMITCCVCTWVGLGIPLSIATYQQSSSPDFPGLVCGIILVGVAIGFDERCFVNLKTPRGLS